MNRVRSQYFLSFAVMGSLLPFLSVYLKDRGLGLAEIGYVQSAASVSVFLTPVVLTFLADGAIPARVLLGCAFAVAGAALAGLAWAEGFWAILLVWSIYSLAFSPITSLQDGLNFSSQRDRLAGGLEAVPYHRVRVWGTIGFMVPSVLLFGGLDRGWTTGVTVALGAGFCLLGVLNSFGLPCVSADAGKTVRRAEGGDDALAPKGRAKAMLRLPTVRAARAMLEPHTLVFCVAMTLNHMSEAAYYGFYPIHLTRRVGLGNEWVGVVAILGVGLEVFLMLGFGRVLRRLGLKRLVLVGVGAMAARMALLAVSGSVVVAVGTQLVHGVTVLASHVAPPIYLDGRAGDSHRHSMQGLYVMAVYGTGRVAGHFMAGQIAEVNLSAVFAWGAGLGVVAWALLAFAFHDHEEDR